jgi:hypothetical protein
MVELSPRKNIRCQSTQAVLSPESLLAIEDLAILAVFTDQDQRRSQPQTSVCVGGGGGGDIVVEYTEQQGVQVHGSPDMISISSIIHVVFTSADQLITRVQQTRVVCAWSWNLNICLNFKF